MKKYIFENDNGKSLTVSYTTEMFLIAVDGTSKGDYAVEMVKQAGIDGERYAGASRNPRYLSFALGIGDNHDLYSDKLYSFFARGVGGTLYSCLDSRTRKIKYYPESIDIDSAGILRQARINLICADPMFRDAESTVTPMANWEDLIAFPPVGGLEIPAQFEVTRKSSSLIKSIVNSSGVKTGIIIDFYASGAVSMPCLIDIARHEQIQIKDSMPMQNGDRITIDTEALTITLTRGEKKINIITSKKYDSRWLQLWPDENLFRYDAASGMDSLSVSITSSQIYGGE